MKVRKLLFVFILSLFVNKKIYSENISLITGNDYQPYSDSKLPEGGLFVFMVKKLFRELNYIINIEFLPWARGYELVKRNKATATFPYVMTEERKKKFYMPQKPLILIKSKVYYHENILNISNLEDLKHKKLCIVNGYFIEENVSNMIQNKEIEAIKKLEMSQCVLSIKNLESDFLLSNEQYINFERNASADHLKFLKEVQKPISSKGLFIVFSKEIDKNLFHKIDSTISKYVNSEKYKKDLEEYYNLLKK